MLSDERNVQLVFVSEITSYTVSVLISMKIKAVETIQVGCYIVDWSVVRDWNHDNSGTGYNGTTLGK